jgi:hypothetical protein
MSQPDESAGKLAIERKTKRRPTGTASATDRQTLEIAKLLKDQSPDNVRNIVEGSIRIVQSTSPELIAATADAKRRYEGMWIGAAFSMLGIAGGVAILTTAAPAAAGIGLMAFGVACAGATFAIATGKSVDIAQFSRTFTDVSRVLSRNIERDDSEQN